VASDNDDEVDENDDDDIKRRRARTSDTPTADHIVRFFIINTGANTSSHHGSEGDPSDPDCSSNEDDDDDDDDDSLRTTELRTELLVEQIRRLRRLFEISTRLLELSQSRRLLAVYSEVSARLQTVLDVELPQLTTAVINILAMEPSLAVASRSSTDPGSNSSIAGSNGLSRMRHSSGVSGGTSVTDDMDDEGPQECLSLLVRPKLVWKAEKQRSNDPLGELWNPCGVSFLQHDEGLVVAEYDMATPRNNKLCIFDVNGKRVSVLAQGQIQPLGVALTREGHIAVTDCKGKRVKIMTLNGQTIADIGKGQFGWPYGITVNSRGQLVVTDAFSDSVSIYNPSDGKRIRQFGSSGTRDANFRNPYHVTVDSRDNILVADSGNDCVKAFDPTGTHFLFHCDVTTPGGSSLVTSPPDQQHHHHHSQQHRSSRLRQGPRGGRLRGPRGLTVDLRGNILVADDCCRICMFDSNGRYVRNLLTDEDWVKYPEAVHCSRVGSGLLAVTEWNPNNMNAVKVFTLYE
jgi:DNA-binding beta-propeller fold protein YncE